MGVDSGLLGSLVHRPMLRSRNDVGYCTVRSWRVGQQRDQVAALKAEKRQDVPVLAEEAGAEVAAFLRKYCPVAQALVTNVPCGHSRRADCFGKRLAQATARELGLPFLGVWADRFCKGVSHPKEFKHLPPLEWVAAPDRFVVVVDDVATSGWHLEEALTALRSRSIPALGVAWIGGDVSDPKAQEPEGPRSIFHGHRGAWNL